MKNILFDLDGTLWDSREQIVQAWCNVLDEVLDVPINLDTLTGLMGQSNEAFKDAFFSGYSDSEADRFLELCQMEEVTYLEKNGANIYDGCIDVIKRLSKKYKLFIISNCQSGYIESFLNYYKLNQYFTDIECCGTTGLSKAENIKLILERNNLSLDESCYVGDTLGDYNSALENNLTFIYSKYGFGNVSDSKYYIDDISDLENLLISMDI